MNSRYAGIAPASKISKVANGINPPQRRYIPPSRKAPNSSQIVLLFCRSGIPLHDGAGNGDAAALVSVALDALCLAARGLGGLDDAVDDGGGGAAGAVAVGETGGS
ncbi:hypothetical protein CSIM01_01718 [Colletotrichum simmondsii]|uniref:Uncharacterized protein n=1 Tax=Colletotrichum simmondsii TaxID=703756 RepID=A0A135T4D1_9PEZI|nr:hypothetical protein CSIM01_01718 [Colletotrichum simmondsii]